MPAFLKKAGLYSSLLVAVFFGSQTSYGAGFDLSFNRSPSAATGSGGVIMNCAPGQTCDGSRPVGGDQTAYSQDIVNVDGTDYFRNVVGETASGFAMTYYTRVGPAGNGGGTAQGYRAQAGSVDSGGMEASKTADTDAQRCKGRPGNGSGKADGVCGNGMNPLGANVGLTGTGTGDPTKMAMKMVLDMGDGMALQIDKPLLGNKPKITQTITTPDLRTEFITDLRALSYSQKDIAADVINRQNFLDPFTQSQADVIGNLDFDGQVVDAKNVTAGQFTFIAGRGWGVDNGNGWEATATPGWQTPNSVFEGGTYDYAGSGASFDPTTENWQKYFNYADNASACAFGQRANSCPGGP